MTVATAYTGDNVRAWGTVQNLKLVLMVHLLQP